MKYEVVVKGTKEISKLGKSVTNVNKQLKQTQKNFDKLKKQSSKIDKSVTSSVDNIHNKFKEFTGSDALQRPLDAFNKQFVHARNSGKGFFSSMKKGFGGLKTAIGRTGLGNIAKVLLKTLGPIALIATAFSVLKTMFQANVGGIATTFYKLFGQIKSMIGKFRAHFIKTLRKIGPLIKVILTPLVRGFKIVFAIIEGVVNGIFAIIDPIADAFNEIGKSLGFMGKQGKQLDLFKPMLKGLTWILTTLGKIIGWVVKKALQPLIIGFKILGFIGKLIFTPIIDGAKKLMNFLQPIFDMIKKIMDWFKGVGKKSNDFKANIEHKFGIDKIKGLFRSGENSQVNNNVKYDNRMITVHTNGNINKNSFSEDSAIKWIAG